MAAPHGFLAETRPLKQAVKAALRAGRTVEQIAKEAGCGAKRVRLLMGSDCHLVTIEFARRLCGVLPVEIEDLKLHPLKRGTIPISVLSEMLEDAVDTLGIHQVSLISGIAQRRIWGMRSGEQLAITFDVADQLVTLLHEDGFMAWHEDPLRSWYHRGLPTATVGLVAR